VTSDHWPASGPASSYWLQHLLVITSTAGFPVNCLIAGLPLRRLGHGMMLGRRCCPDVPCPVTPGGRPLNTGGRGHMVLPRTHYKRVTAPAVSLQKREKERGI